MAEVFFGGLGEFVVPGLAEAADERFFEELVGAQAEFAAEDFGATADFPPVEVDGGEVGVLLEADGVEVAGDGLVEVDTALAVGAFDGAVAHAARFEAGEHTVATIDDGGDEVALLVDICHAVFADFALGGW